jgi:tRNA (guanine37-N1)-methyltransferase
MRIDVLTTFPELFSPRPPGVLGVSIPARAIQAGLIGVHATDIRAFATDKHQKTDDRPFGGGPGMVMLCEPLYAAVLAAEASHADVALRILMTPQGRPLNQALVEDLARRPRLLIIAGHYEGIDERVIEELAPLEISLGDFVLSGGELAALALIDAVARLQPGSLGDPESASQDSFGLVGARGAPPVRLLDSPHYSKPRSWRGREVPEVLLSGDHARIAAWRLQQRLDRTRVRRPDLLAPRGKHD